MPEGIFIQTWFMLTVANVSNYKFRVGWCQCIMDLIIESAGKQVCCKIDWPDV